MAGFVCLRKGSRHALAASLLALLTGCTTLPATPPAPVPPPLSSLTPSEVTAAPVAQVVLPSEPSIPSRLTALAKRWLGTKDSETPAPAAGTQADAAEPAQSGQAAQTVDEKYRFTGEDAREVERGHASWYGPRFHGRRTASGEIYDMYALTAAHKTLPFGTIVRVRSLALGREVDVRINDRGPFAPGRVIDVSHAAAEALGLKAAGVARVSLNVAESAAQRAKANRPGKKARSTVSAGKRSLSSDKRGASTAKGKATASKAKVAATKRSVPAPKRR